MFDRRTLLSAFLPAVVFWGLTTAVALGTVAGPRTVLHGWQAAGTVAQGLALAAFFVWSGLWAFLTAAMSNRSIRFLEGYGPRRGLAAAVRGRLRARHVDAVNVLVDADTGLEARQRVLREAGLVLMPQSTAQDGVDAPPAGGPAGTQQAHGTDQEPGTAEEMERLLRRCESAGDLSDEDLRDLPGRLQAWWNWSVARPAVPGGTDRAELRRRLDPVVRVLAERIARAERAVETERAELLARLSTYPADRSEVMPTALGNVVRASEGYGAERYGMDTVLAWPRLCPLLPDVVVKAEAQARTVLDLLLNVCLSVVLFGLPLSVAVACGGVIPLPWWVPLVPLFCAVAIRSWPAVLLSAAAFVPAAPGLPDGWFHDWSSGPVGAGFHTGLTGLAVVVLLATATYRAAVESAVTWGEQLKAAVDLYRCRLLDELNVRRPADPEQERLVWGEVTGFLHRGYAPDAALVGFGDAEASDTGSGSPRQYPVPVRPLPAFHPVGPGDVQPRCLRQDLPDEPCAGAAEDIVGRIPLQALEAGRPVPVRLLLGPHGAGDAGGPRAEGGSGRPPSAGPLTAVGVSVTSSDGLGGTLLPGDRVDLSLFAADHGVTSVYPDVLVLRYVPGTASSAPDAGSPDTLVVAVEPSLASDLMRSARNTTAVATRPLPLPATGNPVDLPAPAHLPQPTNPPEPDPHPGPAAAPPVPGGAGP
ncbi:hypothetical protein [Streptomyces cirratus]|uniref:hypothetical protein n=1 Tax=Streptomyces cirratus TaxID=68187 RepID=UPI0036228A23